MAQIIDKNNYFIITLISWIFLWFSIGITPNNLNSNLDLFSKVINITRIYVPIFSFLIFSIFIIFIKLFSFEINENKTKSTYINLFLIYFFLQIIGLYTNNTKPFNLENIYLVILALCALQIFIINHLFNNNNLKYLLHASIVICFISSTFVFSFLFFDNIQNLFNNFLNTNFRIIYDDLLQKKIFNHHFPRSTGISRTFGLINIFVIIYFLFCAKKKKIKYLLYTISFIYTSLIWLLQSRGSILIFFITIFIIIFFLKKIKIIKRFFLILIFLFLPIILTELMISYTKNLANDNLPAKNLANDNLSEKKLTNFNNKFKYFVKRNRVITDSTSSGRIAIWKDSFAKYDKNKIFGYGPQGDRFLLEKSESLIQYSNNSSNALIYSLLSGGYFAFLIFLIIYLSILKKIYICFKKFKIFENNNDINIKLSVSYVIYMFLRSFFENSFSLFSIDFLIFLSSAIYIENYLKKN